ncbi:MAG: J domain-containing protein [Desulfovibrionaceae bacterium]|nr:J domain-containing protein [Desulfovibrionaceae bacterium]MDD4953096.1 J domain-containing protein [Desulfovibrionaceae bacterium]
MSVKYKDYYKILGVSKDASKEDISKAFKRLARKHHPDLNPGDKDAEARFKELNEANEVLKDPEKRRMYDTLGPGWQDGQNFQRPSGFENARFHFGGPGGGGAGGFEATGFSDFFETLFGGGAGFGTGFGGGREFRPRPRRGADSEAVFEIGLEDAYHGGDRSVSLQEQALGPDNRPSLRTKTLSVKIPAGVKDGQRIRLSGQGNPGLGGGPAGDLYLKLRILPHPRFKVRGADLVLDLPLAPWEAALGATVRVQTLDGAVDLKVPAGTGSGKKFKLKGRGLGSGEERGDQIVRVMIKTPAGLNEEQERLWRQLADKSDFKPRND